MFYVEGVFGTSSSNKANTFLDPLKLIDLLECSEKR